LGLLLAQSRLKSDVVVALREPKASSLSVPPIVGARFADVAAHDVILIPS
jgi:hypothetical protein